MVGANASRSTLSYRAGILLVVGKVTAHHEGTGDMQSGLQIDNEMAWKEILEACPAQTAVTL